VAPADISASGLAVCHGGHRQGQAGGDAWPRRDFNKRSSDEGFWELGVMYKELVFFVSWDEPGLINDPIVSARMAKVLVMNSLKLLHWGGGKASFNKRSGGR
jgi:hypothetical protein